MVRAKESILAQFEALPDDQKQAMLDRFVQSNPAFAQSTRKAPASRIVREALAYWLLDLRE
jgi:hypothetical protein